MSRQQDVIAIVDDDPDLCVALELLISSWGFQTEIYGSGEEFINAAKTTKSKCLLVDIQLGDITGLELGRQLSAMGFAFPIIFMTGSHEEAFQQRAFDFGCVAFLYKPFPSDQLFESIMKATSASPGRMH